MSESFRMYGNDAIRALEAIRRNTFDVVVGTNTIYTVGLSDLGLSDIVVTRSVCGTDMPYMSTSKATALLLSLGVMWKASKNMGKAETFIKNEFKMIGRGLILRPINDVSKGKDNLWYHAYGACRARDKFRMAQVVFRNRHGVFPWVQSDLQPVWY